MSVVLQVEHPAGRERDVHRIAAGGVQHALRLSGRARGVEDEERVLAVHPLRLAGRGLRRAPARPRATSFGPSPAASSRCAAATITFSTVGISGTACVHVGLERHHRALAPAAVRGDDHLRPGVVHPLPQRLGGEAAEHHRVHRADARAGQHRDGRLGDHRQVDPDAIALLAPPATSAPFASLQTSACSSPVGQLALVARLALEDERRLGRRASPGAGRGSCRRGWSSRRGTTANGGFHS